MGGNNNMKRIIAASLAVGGLTFGLAAYGGSAGATLRPHTGVVLTLSKDANLVAGKSTVVVKGSGWPASTSILVAECNANGAIPSDLDACKILTTATSDSSGDFTEKEGPLVVGNVNPASDLAVCPPSAAEAAVGVQCIIAAAANLTKPDQVTDFVPVFFAPPAPKVTSKKYKKIKGVQTYSVTFDLADAYATQKSGDNLSGWVLTGETSTGSTSCQPTTSAGVTWPGIGLPACTKVVGEKVEVWLAHKELGTVAVSTSAKDPGGFDVTFNKIGGGTHLFTVKGLTSGQLWSGKVKIG